MVARQGTTIVRQEIEFPTEWTMVDDVANLREEPREKENDNEADSGVVAKNPSASESGRLRTSRPTLSARKLRADYRL